jgi:hypothetical protein
MTSPPDVEYLKSQIFRHVGLFHTGEAVSMVSGANLRFMSYDSAITQTGPAVVIPYDIQLTHEKPDPYSVLFGDTNLTLWNRVAKPTTGKWDAVPNDTAPVWYRNSSGTLIPAWNLFGTLFDLLTYGEESRDQRRDGHHRFVGAYSPRREAELLQVPIFNEAVALIVAALAGLKENTHPRFELGNLVKPPVAVLSHDCDISYGNDWFTQAIRTLRILLPLKRLRPPHLSNIWWIISNALWPRRFYFDNNPGMMELERAFGFTSTFYLLNGTGGRFGARNGFAPISEIVNCVPSGWEVGMHYNYDTLLEAKKFTDQLNQLKSAGLNKFVSGRAHYLRFDPEKSLSFLSEHGIRVDESSGYPDYIGYRNGIAGVFQAYDANSHKSLDLWEVPMTVMDSTLVRQYGAESIPEFRRMIFHLSRIGGAMSIIFHPGVFFNPEVPEMLGIYHRMLIVLREFGTVSMHARELANLPS